MLFWLCVTFYDVHATLLICSLKCMTAEEVPGFINPLLHTRTTCHAVSGRESNHYHMASFTCLHFSISTTLHHITQTTKKEKSGKKEHTDIDGSHAWFFKALSGTSAPNGIGLQDVL